MSFPVVQNTQTGSGAGASSGSVTLTKPTGLAVGDLMVACIAFYFEGGTRTLTTPAGWTAQKKLDGTDGGIAVYTKVADSGDVAASNFTFSASASGDCIAGSLSRVTGYTSIGSSESDEASGTGSASVSYTTAVTPTVSDNLVIVVFAGGDATWTGTPSASAYTLTPTETLSEIADVGVKNGTNGLCLGVATADNTGVDQITSRGVTYNDTPAGQDLSIIIIIEGIIDATGTNALLSADADFFGATGSAGTLGTTALLSADADPFDANGKATTPPAWVNTDKNANATFINTEKT